MAQVLGILYVLIGVVGMLDLIPRTTELSNETLAYSMFILGGTILYALKDK